MTKNRYRYLLLATWFVKNDMNELVPVNELYEVHPAYSKMVVNYEKPSAEMYFEQKMDMNIRLIGDESEIVSGKPSATKFTFVVQEREHQREVARCEFRKTDCEIDMNHREVTVKPKGENPYDLLNGHLDDEIDIKPLLPDMETLQFNVRPVMQVYAIGSEYVSTVTVHSISQRELKSNEFTEGDLLRYGFTLKGAMFYANVHFKQEITSLDATVDMHRVSDNGVDEIVMKDNDDLYMMKLVAHEVDGEVEDYLGYKFYMKNRAGQWIEFMSYYPDATHWRNRYTINNYRFTHTVGTKEIGVSSLSCRHVYHRLLTNARGTNIANDDPFGVGVYKYSAVVNDVDISDYMALSTEKTTTTTEYGKYDATHYYAKPDIGDGYKPIGNDVWNGAPSMWLDIKRYYNACMATRGGLTKEMELRDWYTFGSALRVVLHSLDDRIDFEETEEYSQFLFGASNPIFRQGQGRLYILQKSNLLKLSYDVSAASAKVTLRRMLQFMKYALNCYWHFEKYEVGGQTRYRFKVEHVKYYMNGGGYDAGYDTREVIDLNALYDTENKKPMAWRTNKWRYDVGSGNGTATRIQYHWMDKESEVFDGLVDVPSEYRVLTDDVTEERTIEWFSSDIDYLLANADECSKDGFFVVWTAADGLGTGGGTMVPIDTDQSSVTYNVNNYRLAITWLLQHVLLYNIGSKYVKINNKSFNHEVRGVKSMRRSSVEFMPKAGMTIDPTMVKIATEIGEGVIDKMSVDLTSGMVKAELLYELDD